jgi:hypothetical protein
MVSCVAVTASVGVHVVTTPRNAFGANLTHTHGALIAVVDR